MLHRRLSIVLLPVAACLLAPNPGTAKPIERGQFTEHYHLVHKDFCTPGLTVSDQGELTVRYRLGSHGEAGLPYYAEHLVEHGTVTDLATGNSISYWAQTNGKDLHIVDNGDDTWTATWFGTGNFTMYDASGKAIGRNPGQRRETVLVDTNGTPDISDDELIRSLAILKESTGRTDDACAVMLKGLGVA